MVWQLEWLESRSGKGSGKVGKGIVHVNKAGTLTAACAAAAAAAAYYLLMACPCLEPPSQAAG